jgi:hypothetical protein
VVFDKGGQIVKHPISPSNLQKEDLIVEDFGFQIKRKAIGFIGAGVACSIVSFGFYYLINPYSSPNGPETASTSTAGEQSKIALNKSNQLVHSEKAETMLSLPEQHLASINQANTNGIPLDHSKYDHTKKSSPTKKQIICPSKEHRSTSVVSIGSLPHQEKGQEKKPMYEKNPSSKPKHSNPIDFFDFDQPSLINELKGFKTDSLNEKKDDSTSLINLTILPAK